MRSLAIALLACSCGPQLLEDDELGSLDQGVSRPSRLIHWQSNTDWPEATSSGYQVPSHVFRQAATYDAVPDVFALQECGRPCACGGPKNWDATTATCPPPAGSAPAVASEILKQDYDFVVSSWANTVMWRRARFTKDGVFMWNAVDADPGFVSCAPPRDAAGNDAMNIAVRLRDEVNPGHTVVVASMHVGNVPSCTTRLLRYFDTTVREQWGAVDYVFISGDWNMEVSPGARDETNPGCWYELVNGQLDAPKSCGRDFGNYLDAAKVKHPGTGICSQYTFPNPGSNRSANDVRCDSARTLTRIDYTLLRGTSATPEHVLKSNADQGYFDVNHDGDVDFGEIYAGHRSVRTVVEY